MKSIRTLTLVLSFVLGTVWIPANSRTSQRQQVQPDRPAISARTARNIAPAPITEITLYQHGGFQPLGLVGVYRYPFTITLSNDGTATYLGTEGCYKSSLEKSRFERLAQLIQDKGFFRFKPSYGPAAWDRPSLDRPSLTVSVVRNGKRFTVQDVGKFFQSVFKLESPVRVRFNETEIEAVLNRSSEVIDPELGALDSIETEIVAAIANARWTKAQSLIRPLPDRSNRTDARTRSDIRAIAHAKSSQEQPLLKRATKVIDTSGWILPFYHWYDAHILLALSGFKGVFLQDFALVDTTTRHIQPLTALNRRWKQWLQHDLLPSAITPQTDQGFCLLWVSLSPDRKWIAWHRQYCNSKAGGIPYYKNWEAVSLDGTEWVEDSMPSYLGSAGAIWSKDSKQCFVLERGSIRVLDLNTRQFLSKDSSLWLGRSSFAAYWDLEPLGVRFDGRGVVVGVTVDKTQTFHMVHLMDFSLGEDTPPHQVQVSLPQQRWFEDVVLSPDGRRLAWQLYELGVPQPKGQWQRVREEFWISQADGARMRPVGWIAEKYKGSLHFEIYPDSFQWTPDGKRLSFIYKDALYTVPAD